MRVIAANWWHARHYGLPGRCDMVARERDYLVLAVISGDLPAWDADNRCMLCGAHMADPHHPSCEILREDGS